MTSESFAAISELCTNAIRLAGAWYTELSSATDKSGQTINLDNSLPSAEVSIHTLNYRLTTALGLCGRLEENEDTSLIPTPFITEVNKAITNLGIALEQNLKKNNSGQRE